MKLTCIILALSSLALPALAQEQSVTVGGVVTIACTCPFGDHSRAVLASNSGSDSVDCEATCVAHNSEDDTGLSFFTVRRAGQVPVGASNLLMCSRGRYQGGALEKARVATDFELTRCQ